MPSEQTYIGKIVSSSSIKVDGRGCFNDYRTPVSANVNDGPNLPVASGVRVNASFPSGV